MRLRFIISIFVACFCLTGCSSPKTARPSAGVAASTDPIIIGHSFVMDSAEMNEPRRITVFLPPGYDAPKVGSERYPVLYLLDGGAAEDFHHITGIVQVSVMNAIMQPLIVIGIENTKRRRDLSGPTENAEDRKMAPRVGGSAAFRAFIANELVPRIERAFRTNGHRGIIGESLAGLFVMETLFEQPSLFENYIAVSPSLWWNNEYLNKHAAERLKTLPLKGRTLYLTVGGTKDGTEEVERMAAILKQAAPPELTWHYLPLANEMHSTVFHPAATHALRLLYPVKAEATK